MASRYFVLMFVLVLPITSFACNSQQNPDDETWSLDSYRIAAGFGTIAVLLGYIQIKLQTTLFQSAPATAQGSLVAGALTIISLALLPTFQDKNLRQILRHAANIFGSLWAILLLLVLSPVLAWILLAFWAIGAGAALSGKKVSLCLQNLYLRITNPIDEATGVNRAAMQQTQEHQQEQQV